MTSRTPVASNAGWEQTMTGLENFLSEDLLNPGTFPGTIFYGLAFLVLATVVARLVRLTVAQTLRRDHKQLIDRTVATFLTQLAQIGIYLLAIILYAHLIPALRSLGTALLASVSVASVIIGLAAQNTLGNLIAGIALLLYRPFKVGDNVQVNAPSGLEIGTIETLTLGYTVLRTFDDRRIVVPNSVMASQVTVNLAQARAMALVPFSIGYAYDIDKARHILMELAQNHPLVQEVVSCPVTQLGYSRITLSLRAWCANTGDADKVKFDLYEQAKKRFEQEEIEFRSPWCA
jgi:small conductance mechanosensitive channel